MWKGVLIAYAMMALCYFPVAIIGYWVFGDKVEDNILISLQKPWWLIALANMFVVFHVIGSYQVNLSILLQNIYILNTNYSVPRGFRGVAPFVFINKLTQLWDSEFLCLALYTNKLGDPIFKFTCGAYTSINIGC